MNHQSKKPRGYLVGIIFFALIGLIASYMLNQKQFATDETYSIVPNQEDMIIPTIVPLESMLMDEDSSYGQRELATDFDPIRVEVEQAGIDAKVRSVGVNPAGYVVTPSHSAGYWIASAKLNEPGNIVIVGHNRDQPMSIFRNLDSVQLGSQVILTDGKAREYSFVVTKVHIIGVDNAPDEEANRIIEMMSEQPAEGQMLTIVSCHPTPHCSNRIILIAEPLNPTSN